MHDFGSLVYLDVQKTGSTFISAFLNQTCTLPCIREQKHQRITTPYNKDAFYFISIRHPYEQYKSLFRYGLDRKGELFLRLNSFGFSHLYTKEPQAFDRFVCFMLDPKHAQLLGEGYKKALQTLDIGFMTHRHLMLSFVDSLVTLKDLSHRDKLSIFYKERTIVKHIIRNEQLNADLFHLATELKPEFFDRQKVEDFLKQRSKINISQKQPAHLFELSSSTKELFLEKESFLLNHVWYSECN